MKSNPTLQDKIVLLLAENRGEWIPSYSLSKRDTAHGWIGSSGERRARELAEDGTHTIKGVKYFIEKKIDGKYAYYRVTGGTKLVSDPVIVYKDGKAVVEINYKQVTV